MRWLALLPLLLLGCTHTIAGHHYTGADLELRYHRSAGFQHDSHDTVKTWPPVEVSSHSEQGRNGLVLGMTLHFSYQPPKKKSPD